MLTIAPYCRAMPSASTDRPRATTLAAAAVLGAGYFMIAAFTVRYTRFEGGVAFVWAATALLLANLTLQPVGKWGPPLFACWIASFAATTLYGFGGSVALPLAFVNIGEAAVGALLLRRFCPRIGEFRSITEVGAFIMMGGIVAPALTAFAGAACAAFITHTGYWGNWLNWYTGHALGTLIFAPLLILSFSGETVEFARDAGRRGIGEALALLLGLVATTAFVFAQARLPLLFLPFLPMMLTVFRLGRFGAVMSTAILSVVATILTLHGSGPVLLIAGGIGVRAQFFQFYLATAVLMVLPAAAELKRRKTLFATLQETSTLQQLILDRTSDIIMRLELDGTVSYVSPSVHRVGGYTPEELIGRKPHDLIFADDMMAVIEAHQQALASPSETVIVEYRAQREDGGLGWFETHTRATVDEADRPTGAVSIIREVTQRKQFEAVLEERASTDPLTGLLNRRAFDAAVAHKLSDIQPRTDPGCVAVFDLDRFKSVNDRFGHATGDIVIQRFAEVLRATVRSNDVIARFGGEEFVAFLDGANPAQASIVCERVRTRFECLAIRDGEGRTVSATVSAGLASVRPGVSLAIALKAADDALYRSKAAGRNQLTLAA